MPEFRVALVGGAGVGKTALWDRLRRMGRDHRALRNWEPTLLPSFCVHLVPSEGGDVSLHLLDTPGSLRAFQRSDYFSSDFDAVIFPFSIDSLRSLEILPTYMKDVSSKTPNRPPFVLLGLKADLEEERQVTHKIAECFAAQHGLKILPSLLEVSCKTYKNLDMVGPSLVRLCREYRAQQTEGQPEPQPHPSVETETEGPMETTAMPETTTAAEPASAEPAQPPPTGPGGVALLPDLETLCCTLM